MDRAVKLIDLGKEDVSKTSFVTDRAVKLIDLGVMGKGCGNRLPTFVVQLQHLKLEHFTHFGCFF